jgi:hypothetical protein
MSHLILRYRIIPRLLITSFALVVHLNVLDFIPTSLAFRQTYGLGLVGSCIRQARMPFLLQKLEAL